MTAKTEDRADAAPTMLPANILVVDDDAINLLVIEQMLETSDYAVVSAVDGVDAVEKAALIRPTLILMDISMPRMNGIDAAIAIRERFGDQCPKIVAVTANVADRQREACKLAGFHDFLGKPINMKVLLALVEKFLAGYEIS